MSDSFPMSIRLESGIVTIHRETVSFAPRTAGCQINYRSVATEMADAIRKYMIAGLVPEDELDEMLNQAQQAMVEDSRFESAAAVCDARQIIKRLTSQVERLTEQNRRLTVPLSARTRRPEPED